jgi:sugar (pentulose or hexulose) kinase
MVSDVTGKTVHVPSGSEFGALGASITSGLATGIYGDIGEGVKQTLSVTATFHPNMVNHQKYSESYRLYRSLYEHIWDDWDMRSKIVNKLRTQESRSSPGDSRER